jgi:hypothetical protein
MILSMNSERLVLVASGLLMLGACVLNRTGERPGDEQLAGGGGTVSTGGTTNTGGSVGGTSSVGGSPGCGDGEVTGTEQCDGDNLDGRDCTDLGYTEPAGMVCVGCAIDDSGCGPTCNGQLEPDEVCDGTRFGGRTCVDEGFVNPDGLACEADCSGFDTSGCTAACDNGTTEPTEDCDDGNDDPFDGCHRCRTVDTGCAAPIPVSLALGAAPTVHAGSTAAGMDDAQGSCGDTMAAPDHVYEITAESDGFLSAWLHRPNSDYDTVLYAQSTCGAAMDVACADNYPNGGEVLSFEVGQGQSYFIVVDGYQGASGGYELHLSLDAGTCADPVEFPSYTGVEMCASGVTTGKSNERSGGGCGDDSGEDVVYRTQFFFTGSMDVRIDDAQTGFDSVLTIDDDCGSNNVSCDHTDPGDDLSTIDALVNGGDIFVWVDGFGGADGKYTMCIDPPDS